MVGDGGVDRREGIGILDEIGAPDNGSHDAVAEDTIGEQGGQPGQPAIQRHAQVQLAAGPPVAEAQNRRHLRCRGVPGIAGPQSAVVITATAAGQLRDRRETASRRRGLGPGERLDGIDDGGVIQRPQTIEHTFYSATRVRQVR